MGIRSLKTLSVAVLAGFAVVSLVGCGKSAPKPKTDGSSAVASAAAPAASPAANQVSVDELQSAKWTVMRDTREKTVYYRAGDAGSKGSLWLKSVEKDDGDIDYKRYQTDCAGNSAVMKVEEIEVKRGGAVKREAENDRVDDFGKSDAIRSLICGK